MSFNLQQLTEGIRQRHVGTQNKRLVEKWNRTGLLRGLDDVSRENMSTLLENQAAQVLREANTLGGDGGGQDIRGFTNIAFPIVRRVFGGLVANELVSSSTLIIPMVVHKELLTPVHHPSTLLVRPFIITQQVKKSRMAPLVLAVNMILQVVVFHVFMHNQHYLM